jgi:hypothetical protein
MSFGSVIKDSIKAIAPVIGGALGGPLGAAALKSLSIALLGKEESTENELKDAIQNATPEQILKIKEADYQFAIKQQEISVKDLENARQREIELQKSGNRDWMPPILTIMSFLGTYFLIGLISMFHQDAEDNVYLKTTLEAFITWDTAIIIYYFGFIIKHLQNGNKS